MKYKHLALAISTLTANAYALEGSVVNSEGDPIADAIIEFEGSRDTVVVSQQGTFLFDEKGVSEIHVTAPGYSHKVIHLDELNPNETLVISLSRSVIEQIDVIGIPIHASVIESAQPISVLSGDELRNRQAATLGDSLENEVGVHSNFHGNVASTPIIRGLSGPRVQITQNSLDVSDVSRVGPDHAVASEVSTAEQVEVLRGPATLFFGSGAIGGVVNVVDKRVPKDADTYGEWYVSHETVNSQNLGSVNLNTGAENVAFHLDGFWRESDDYEVPVAPEQDHEEEEHDEDKFTVGNSGDESHGFTLGSSYLLDNGYVGVSFGRLDREYGIPGHSHGGHEHEADEESVYADLEQDRVQLISELDLDNPWLSAINTRVGYTDYTHAEIEEGVAGTIFSNKTTEAKLDLMHQPFNEWKGGLVFHYKNSDASAVGEEAFTPPSDSETFALALVEERHLGDFLVQLGARIERVTINADKVLLPQLEAHSHDGDDEEHDHEHEEESTFTRVFQSEQEFTPVSLSAGVVWDFTPGYNVALSFTHAERAPSDSELLSFGSHIGTRSFEIGALFDLHEEGSEAHFELNENPIELETSNNIDLTFRKHEGNFGLILNAFLNQVDNYYYQAATGLYAESSHSHEHDHDDEETVDEDIHADELPIYLFTSADAELYGFEAQGIWQITPNLKSTVFSDYVHTELKDTGAYLPRTPPLRYGARFDYQWNSVTANLSWSHYEDQNKVAALETPTLGYDWIDAVVTWNLPVGSSELALFVKAENITDTEARIHTSFLKDIAPKPGRNFSIGIRGSF
ncbi:TonB-dependent receptor [Teredinibacter turnerae]|uniref:TonB-dependent receptor n=1 Tax=Teredinibacter turnerae TaxID=2426 RepID=UPI00036B9651|nr:TonB-dependent receptor [Teredinibacter turnerae]